MRDENHDGEGDAGEPVGILEPQPGANDAKGKDSDREKPPGLREPARQEASCESSEDGADKALSGDLQGCFKRGLHDNKCDDRRPVGFG